jgi:hypothetical protein
MSFEWLSVYACAGCGVPRCTTDVEYDRFGYPVCDRCKGSGRARAARN